ncbi:MAG: NUDIX domain-containing protein [Saprospiraceae bacterium]
MYKIYINETKVVLLPSKKFNKDDYIKDDNNLVCRYTNKTRHILNYIDMFEKSNRIKSLTLFHDDFPKLKSDFLSLFKIVEAGGGLVLNEKNEILFIYRKGNWDLPKGKLESKETRKKAAVREVMEETGITGIQIGKKLLITNHTYKNKSNKRCIKKSHWYLMYAPNQKLTPQTEEDIELTEWMTLEQFSNTPRKVYPNILDILKKIKTNKK